MTVNRRIPLTDEEYVLTERAASLDVGPFTVRLFHEDGALNIIVFDVRDGDQELIQSLGDLVVYDPEG